MIKKCAAKIADWLIRCEAAEETERELYEYAVYSIFLTVSPVILAIAFGFLFGTVWQSILIILPFVIVRKFSGGYHTKSAGTCLIGSSLLLMLCIVFSLWIKCNWLLMINTILSAVSLICFSPIENENRLLSEEERVCYKKVTAIIVISFILIILILFQLCMHTCVVCVSIGIILSAVLQVPCILRNLFCMKQ